MYTRVSLSRRLFLSLNTLTKGCKVQCDVSRRQRRESESEERERSLLYKWAKVSETGIFLMDWCANCENEWVSSGLADVIPTLFLCVPVSVWKSERNDKDDCILAPSRTVVVSVCLSFNIKLDLFHDGSFCYVSQLFKSCVSLSSWKLFKPHRSQNKGSHDCFSPSYCERERERESAVNRAGTRLKQTYYRRRAERS